VTGVRTWVVWTSFAIGLLSGCEAATSERVASACSAICACEELPLPAIQDRCIAECTAEAADEQFDIPDECLACISNHETCSTLERDCEPLCDPPSPEPEF
jgi:hypothetical protein